jgi:hypothetical protein
VEEEVNMRSAMEHFLLGGKWDMKLIQDYNFKIAAGKTNTIQFSVDVLNLSNLLNSKWGLVQVPTSIQPIGVSVDSNTNIPTHI